MIDKIFGDWEGRKSKQAVFPGTQGRGKSVVLGRGWGGVGIAGLHFMLT